MDHLWEPLPALSNASIGVEAQICRNCKCVVIRRAFHPPISFYPRGTATSGDQYLTSDPGCTGKPALCERCGLEKLELDWACPHCGRVEWPVLLFLFPIGSVGMTWLCYWLASLAMGYFENVYLKWALGGYAYLMTFIVIGAAIVFGIRGSCFALFCRAPDPASPSESDKLVLGCSRCHRMRKYFLDWACPHCGKSSSEILLLHVIVGVGMTSLFCWLGGLALGHVETYIVRWFLVGVLYPWACLYLVVATVFVLRGLVAKMKKKQGAG